MAVESPDFWIDPEFKCHTVLKLGDRVIWKETGEDSEVRDINMKEVNHRQ
jgi:hypothetical protein